MGYLYQSIALRGRYKRRKNSWQPHLDSTKAYISEVIRSCRKRGKVIVLGSGLLLDLPVAELSAAFDEVVLVDIVHLNEVRKRAGNYPNVGLIQADITGVAVELFEKISLGIGELPEGCPNIPSLDEKTGLVISLNIMSQLAAIPAEYLSKNMTTRDEPVIDKWCEKIRHAHHAALTELGCVVCLIADYEFIRRDNAGVIIGQGSTVGNLALPAPDRTWTWHIEPYGEERRNSSKELIIGAWNSKEKSGKKRGGKQNRLLPR
jgi:hypothetical protein